MNRKQNGAGKRMGTLGFILLCVLVFIVVFAASAMIKLTAKPAYAGDMQVQWSEQVGTVVSDIAYGEKDSNTFDLYLPAGSHRENYQLVVYLHAGGFTSGDKKDDTEMLQWLCSKGYVACGINYTLFGEAHPDANVYTQSVEIREAMPIVIAEAEKAGYPIDAMAISGGSAGHCLAMLYAYRDAAVSPIPVKMVFGGVGPSSFYPEDWSAFGLDQRTEETDAAAAGLFGMMVGHEIDPKLIGTPAYEDEIRDISALLWVNDDTVPSLMAYGAHDKMQAFPASIRLDQALTEHGVPHDYLVFEHSGHGLQNDDRMGEMYYQKICEYLATYLPVH